MPVLFYLSNKFVNRFGDVFGDETESPAYEEEIPMPEMYLRINHKKNPKS